jgi:hypothetical protein
MRVLCTLVLVLALSGIPAFAQTLREAAAHHGALAAQQGERREMPAGLKWTGIGLLAGGGATILIGAAVTDEDCYDVDFTCSDLRAGFYVVGGILAGAGATLLAIASAKRRPVSPSLVMQRGRLLLQQRVSF